MPKSQAKPEIYILIMLGFKPQEIIKMGFSKGSVYSCHAKFPIMMERLKAKLIKIIKE